MPPFYEPRTVITGLKEKVDAVLVQGDRLYLGTAVGNLHIYAINDDAGAEEDIASLVEVKKGLARRSIEQLGFIRDINSLVVLSEMNVTLYPLPTFAPPTALSNAKAAFSFTMFSHIQHVSPEGTFEQSDAKPIPTLITYLVVGCRRKVVIYTWKDGEAQEIKESPLAHSPRVITFMKPDRMCFAYEGHFATFDLNTMTATDVILPVPSVAAGTGMSAFTGLTGYMTLGLGAKTKPVAVQINDNKTLVVRDQEGIIIAPDGTESRPASIDWPSLPEDVAFVKPYLFSVLPAGTVASGEGTFHPTSVLQIRSSISLQQAQALPFPFLSSASPTPHNATIRLLTPSPNAKSPLYLITTPTDRTAATSDGSTVWRFAMKPWAEQIDELIEDERYSDALALLDTVSPPLPDLNARRAKIRGLNAVAHFKAAKYDAAIDALTELDVNPAKVVALYPESVAGRLSITEDRWIPLFGGPEKKQKEGEEEEVTKAGSPGAAKRGSLQEKDLAEQLGSLSTSGSIRGKFKTGLGSLITGGSHSPKDDDAASVHSVSRGKKPPPDNFQRSLETLVRYLSDRRPKVDAALAAVQIAPSQSHRFPSLRETSLDDLSSLPNAPLSQLTPEQLVRFAQIVDTVLFKSYLIKGTALLGSLCRLPNWCEVTEVEEELRQRKKFGELIDLYKGKKMHDKALALLKQLSDEEDDKVDKLQPSIYYLQKLGPEYIDQVFSAARWMFEVDSDMTFEIFTSEDVELPQKEVANFLEGIDPPLCARFLEFLISERHADSAHIHNRLAELYLSMTLAAKNNTDEFKELYSKLLNFIDTTEYYNVDHLYGILSTKDLYEARAILLGRLGRHDQALELYAYHLKDHLKAEEYCKRYYQPDSTIFLTLLKTYLRPTAAGEYLQPALGLISRHSPRLDTVETLKLLPPLVTAQDVRVFLTESLRAPILDTRIVKAISRARNDQLAKKLMTLQTKRVKVTDARICPQCHKRLGGSVIAIHAPRGEVTHFHCREAFTQRLKERH